jgi:tryptophan-rich sensory protein
MTVTAAKPWRAVLVAALAAMGVAVLGGAMTQVGPWYHNLAKPAWTPPDVAFGVIWTVIFAFAAASGSLAWIRAKTVPTRETIIGLFAANGFFNVFWSLLFFTLHRPDWALWESLALWLSVAALVVFLSRVSRTAGLMTVPYLVWVSVAVLLNYDVLRLNGRFG